MIITSEYIYDNNKLNETRNILQNTIEEYEETYGLNYKRVVKVKCVGEFYDKLKNETKTIIIDRYHIIGELNKIVQKSRGWIKLVKIIEVKIIFEGRSDKNIMDMYFICECMPILWKKFYGRHVKKDVVYIINM